MPLYDYRCIKCDEVVEVMRPLNSEVPELCAVCGQLMIREVSAPSFRINGKMSFKQRSPNFDPVIGRDMTQSEVDDIKRKPRMKFRP